MFNAATPRFFLTIYLGLLIVRPQEFISWLSDIPLLLIGLILCVLSWLVYPDKRLRAPQFLLVIGFFLTMIVSTVLNGWAGGATKIFSDFMPVLCMLVIVGSSINSEAQIRQTFAIIMVLVSVLVFHGINQKETGIGWTGAMLSQGTRITYTGILNDPNDLAVLFVLAIACAAYFAGKENSRFTRLVGLLAVPLFCYGIFLTESRGGLMATGALFLVLFGFRYGWIKASIIGVVGAVGASALLSGRITEIDGEDESAADRVQAWYEGFQMFQAHKLFGVGKGNFVDYNFGLTAHNSFVLALAELGIVGFFFYISMIAVSFMMLYKTFRLTSAAAVAKNADELARQRRALSIALMSALAGVMAASFFLSRTYFIMTYFLLGLIIAYYQTVFAGVRKPLAIEFPKLFVKLVGITLVAVVFLRIVIKILLVMQK